MTQFWKSGNPFVWLTGAALAASVLMIVGLVLLILFKGLSQFWPSTLAELHLQDGSKVMGEIWDREEIPDAEPGADNASQYRLRLKVANRDLYSLDFRWIDESDIQQRLSPPPAIAIERQEWGNFYGYFVGLKKDGETVAADLVDGWPTIEASLDEMRKLRERIKEIEKSDIGDINHDLERLRLGLRKITLASDTTTAETRQLIADKRAQMADLQAEYLDKEKALADFYGSSRKIVLSMVSVDGHTIDIPVYDIVRIWKPNELSVFGKCGIYLDKLWEFVTGEPRESNTEGGIFPAIFGTVMLVIIMSIAVVPLGVLAAVYLREYARQGVWVRAIRIAVNNLAGVPSIVYGVFGLGFFIYGLGGTLDQLFFSEALPTPTFGTGGIFWASLTLALLTVPVVIVATEEGLAAVPREIREGSLALSATKFETLWRVVLPSAMPGILTGLILAVARAAGEVAPLMITGVVKLAPALPLDGTFPFLHLERKFMHLGFHIYDVGFQSPNVEAAIPMVYSTTLLLLVIVVFLNLFAIYVRNRLREKLAYSAF